MPDRARSCPKKDPGEGQIGIATGKLRNLRSLDRTMGPYAHWPTARACSARRPCRGARDRNRTLTRRYDAGSPMATAGMPIKGHRSQAGGYPPPFRASASGSHPFAGECGLARSRRPRRRQAGLASMPSCLSIVNSSRVLSLSRQSSHYLRCIGRVRAATPPCNGSPTIIQVPPAYPAASASALLVHLVDGFLRIRLGFDAGGARAS